MMQAQVYADMHYVGPTGRIHGCLSANRIARKIRHCADVRATRLARKGIIPPTSMPTAQKMLYSIGTKHVVFGWARRDGQRRNLRVPVAFGDDSSFFAVTNALYKSGVRWIEAYHR